jgi:ankyrin repeat protein
VNALAVTFNANVEAADQDGKTELMIAAEKGHTDTVNALAGTHNANVEAVDKSGKTALMHATDRGHTNTVNALRRHEASIADNDVRNLSAGLTRMMSPRNTNGRQ